MQMHRRSKFTRSNHCPFPDGSNASDIPVDVVVFVKKNGQHHVKQRRSTRGAKIISKYYDVQSDEVSCLRRNACDDNAVSSEEEFLASKLDMFVRPSAKYYDSELDVVDDGDRLNRGTPVRLRSIVLEDDLSHEGSEFIAIPTNWKCYKPGMYLVDKDTLSPTDSVLYVGKSLSDEDLLVTEDDVFSVASTPSKYYDSGVDVSDADSPHHRKNSSNGNSEDTNISFGSMASIHSDFDVYKRTSPSDDMEIPINDASLVSCYVPSYYRPRLGTLKVDTSVQTNALSNNMSTLSRRMQRMNSEGTSSHSSGSNSEASSTRYDLAAPSTNEDTHHLDPQSRDISTQRQNLHEDSIKTSKQRANLHPIKGEIPIQRHSSRPVGRANSMKIKSLHPVHRGTSHLHPVNRGTSKQRSEHRNDLHSVSRDSQVQRQGAHPVCRKTATQSESFHPVVRKSSVERAQKRDEVHRKNKEPSMQMHELRSRDRATSMPNLNIRSVDSDIINHRRELNQRTSERKQLISEKVLYTIRGTPNPDMYPPCSPLPSDSHDMMHNGSLTDFGVDFPPKPESVCCSECAPLCTKPPAGANARREKNPPPPTKMRDINTIMHEITNIKTNLYSSLLNLHLLNESSLSGGDVTLET